MSNVVGYLWMAPGGYMAVRVWVHSKGKPHRFWRAAGGYLAWPVLTWQKHWHLKPEEKP